MNRRDLLKFFAAGTVIAPVSGAAPLAKLIEVPNVQLVEAPVIVRPFDMSEVNRVIVALEMMDGTTRRIAVDKVSIIPGNTPIAINEEVLVSLTLSRARTASPVVYFRAGDIVGTGKLS